MSISPVPKTAAAYLSIIRTRKYSGQSSSCDVNFTFAIYFQPYGIPPALYLIPCRNLPALGAVVLGKA